MTPTDLTPRWGPHQIPIVVTPGPGEALDNWLERYARRLHVCSSDLLDHLGLHGSTLARMLTQLTSGEIKALGTATGLQAGALTAMTLQPFDTIAVSIDPVSRALVHPPAWRRQHGSRFCPPCLARGDDRWLLTWRLPWTFACPIHDVLLVDTCPACLRRPAPHHAGIGAEPSPEGRCLTPLPRTAPGQWRARCCGHALSGIQPAALPGAGLIATGQHRIDHLLTTAAASPHPAERNLLRRELGELHVLAYKSLTALHTAIDQAPDLVHAILGEGGTTVPARRGALDSHDAHAIGVGTAIAVAAHRDDATGQDLLAWILHAETRLARPAFPGTILRAWKDAGPHLTGRILSTLDPSMFSAQRLSYASASTHPRLPTLSREQLQRRAACLPALLWPAWSIRLLPAATHTALISVRATLAALTLIPGTTLSCPQARAMLDPDGPEPASTVLTRLPADQRTATLAILTDLARALDQAPAPIDYQRRRVLFSRPTTSIDRAAYTALATAHGWRPPSPLQLRLLEDHLTDLLTGANSYRRNPTPAIADSRSTRTANTEPWNPLTVALPRPIRRFLDDQAQHLLRRHHLDEPLTWRPPPPPDPPAPWPGLDPTTLDPDHFARAFARHANDASGLRRISEATGLSDVHAHLYSQIIDLEMPEEQWDSLAGHTHDGLDPADLKHLYQDRELSISNVARLSLTTRRVVRDTLTSHGITPQANRAQQIRLSSQWFQENYLDTPNALGTVAALTGYSLATLTKRAAEHGIPANRRAAPYNPFASWPPTKQPPPPVTAACSGPRGIEYVRQVLHMPGHATQHAAAASLGIADTVLARHRKHVEHAAGIRLFHFEPGSPITPTSEGANFIHHATRALNHHDEQKKRS